MIKQKDRAATPLSEVFKRLTAYAALCGMSLFALDILYRLDSMIKAMSTHDWLVSVCAMFLFVLTVGAAMTLAASCIVLAVWPLRGKLLVVARMFALIFLIVLVMRGLVQWLLKTTDSQAWVIGHLATSVLGLQVPTAVVLTTVYVLTVVTVILVLLKKGQLAAALNGIDRMGTQFAKAAVPIAILALGVCGYHMYATAEARTLPVCSSDSSASGSVPAAARSGTPLPDIVLVTFDALTAQDMSLYGYRLPTTPAMEKFARESHVFEHATSVSNWTKPGTVSILTGQYPHHHHLFSALSDAKILRHPERTLPNQLRELGYQTTAIVSNPSFGHPYMNGTYRSFDVCPWNVFSHGFLDGNLFGRVRHALRNKFSGFVLANDIHISGWADDLLNSFAALRFWRSVGIWNEKSFAPSEITFERAREVFQSKSGQPKFVWVHFFPPHSPYLPAAPFRGRFLVGDEFGSTKEQHYAGLYSRERQPEVDRLRLRYDEFILNADDTFGKFVEFLKKSGRWGNTMMVVSSDHGESFSHGVYGHRGEYLYQQLTHIPLLVHLPGQTKGSRIGGIASQVDIAPTVLSYLNVPTPSWMDGEPLVLNDAGKTRNSYRYSMEIERNGIRMPIRAGAVAANDGRYKLIYSLTKNSTELFDLEVDPHEQRNIAHENPQVAQRMRAAIQARIK